MLSRHLINWNGDCLYLFIELNLNWITLQTNVIHPPAIVQEYIDSLHSQLDMPTQPQAAAEEEPLPAEEPTNDSSELPQYSSGEDYDQATTYKMEASDLKSAGDYAGALEKYNLAITAAPPSALLMANRADALYRLERFEDAVGDCDLALEKNPDRLVSSSYVFLFRLFMLAFAVRIVVLDLMLRIWTRERVPQVIDVVIFIEMLIRIS